MIKSKSFKMAQKTRPISLRRPQMSYCNLLQLLRVRTNFTSISPHWPAAHVLSCVQQTALWSWRDPPTEPCWLLSFNETNSQTRSRLLLILTMEGTDGFENGSCWLNKLLGVLSQVEFLLLVFPAAHCTVSISPPDATNFPQATTPWPLALSDKCNLK